MLVRLDSGRTIGFTSLPAPPLGTRRMVWPTIVGLHDDGRVIRGPPQVVRFELMPDADTGRIVSVVLVKSLAEAEALLGWRPIAEDVDVG